MASASRATARMSSAEGLFAIRYSGMSRANAVLAGSSDGNGLSVIAIRVWAMASLHTAARPSSRTSFSRSSRQHFRIDDVRGSLAFQDGENVVDHDVRHLLPHVHDGAAEMRGENHVGHLDQLGRHL